MNKAFNQHKQGCLANVSCLVIHSDGVCPGPYGICTCDQIVEKSVETIKVDITGQSTMNKKHDWEVQLGILVGEMLANQGVTRPVPNQSAFFSDSVKIVNLVLQNRQELLESILAEITKKRQEVWRFYHEAQLWAEQKEAVKPYDEIITSLRTKFGGGDE